TTARMAAACEIRTMEDPKEIAALGEKYQLMSQFTNYLAIDVKAEGEKAGDLPALRKTPQMLAAGWGGSGTVVEKMDICYSLEEPMFSRREMAYSDDNLQQPPISGMLPGKAYKRTIEKLIDKARNLSEQSRMAHKEFLEHLSRQLHHELTELQEKMFSLQEDKLVQFVENIQFKRKEILIEEIDKYLRSSINDHLRSVSEIFRNELHEYENVVKHLCHDVVDQFKGLVNDAPIFAGPVDFNKWVEFGKTLERHFRLQGAVKKLLSIKELQKFGVPDGVASFLRKLIKGKDTETEIVCAFLYVLLRHPIESLFSRETKRIIRKQYKDVTPDEKLYKSISEQLIPENQI
ncbi:MAG: hypothetical protein JW902_07785, partial [Syntrophaceae bacterium]|nr:hypothetical protein [Syntrophaceae bacterium]